MTNEGFFALLGILFIIGLFPIILFFIMTTLWIWIIIYCCKYQKKDRNTWILVCILGGPAGGIVYFFNRDKKPKTNLHSC
jgi:formate hydrogenlyase subunit 3/multisubunit Na+/H+ antiporter MnhD subunit